MKQNNSQYYDLIVAGAGPAGLMAAATAAHNGLKTAVCEQKPKPGLKLLASGGAKCNITNVLPQDDFIRAFGRQGRFMIPALNFLSSEALRAFFAKRGVPTMIEDDKFHIFPVSHKAADVLKALITELEKLKVEILSPFQVKRLIIEDSRICGMQGTDSTLIKTRALILACGGKGYPALGGSSAGYELASSAGHEIKEPLPALCGLQTIETWPGESTGNSMKDAEVFIDIGAYRNKKCRGELLFTHKGLSGPSVIDLAGDVSELLLKNKTVPISVNLFASYTPDFWMTKFDEWQKNSGKKLIRMLMLEFMTRSVADNLCAISRNCGDMKASEFRKDAREALCKNLTALQLNIKAADSWEKAMVTRGGVSLKKINPETLESKLVEGLFFAGEILDLDGPCGGFNLQWAFSSGALAGYSAASKIH